MSNKILWLDANAITGKSDGDAVASWASRHDGSVAATQSTGSQQPTYKTNQINSLPALDFNADELRVTYGSGVAPDMTAFVVFKYDTTTGNGSNNVLDGIDGDHRAVNFSIKSGGYGSYSGNWLNGTSGASTNWTYATIALDNGASSNIRINGV